MTQIMVTLEDGSDLSLVSNAIRMIKGVKNTLITHLESKKAQDLSRIQLFDQLAKSISLDMIDTHDERTKYILEK